MQFTSSVGFSTNETPITLEWAEENFKIFEQGILFKNFLINKKADCFLSWYMDEDGNEWGKLHLHHAIFDVKYIEELEWICDSFGVKTQKDNAMLLIPTIDLKIKTPISKKLIKRKYAPILTETILSNTIETIRYMVDADLKLCVTFEAQFGEDYNKIYIDCSDCECKLEVKYMEQIEWVINKLKSIKSWKN